MPSESALLTPAGYTAWVYDPQHDSLDIVTASGAIMSWSLAQGAYTLTAQAGRSLDAVAVSPDGRYLLAGGTDPDLSGVASNVFARVDLGTGGLTTISMPGAIARSDAGISQLQITADGSAIYSDRAFNGSQTNYHQFAVAAPGAAATAATGLQTMPGFDIIRASEDHRYLLFGDWGTTGGALALYDSAAGRVTASVQVWPDLQIPGGANQMGTGDISSAAHLIADVTVSGLLVFDLGLQLTRNLTSVPFVSAAAFAPGGHQLFIWQGALHDVTILDTASWTQIATFNVAGSPATHPGQVSNGLMAVTNQGHAVVLDEGASLQVIDLSSVSYQLQGDAGANALYGGYGGDSLSGGDGGDTLTGGAGADTLSGGAGADLFALASGDSPAVSGQTDVITDWSAADHLAFGGAAGSALNFAKVTAASFAAAQALASQQIAVGLVDYVAASVGGDVIVFADTRGDNTVGDAVLLRGASLADIGAANIFGSAQAGLPEPVLPPIPTPTGPFGAQGSVGGDMDDAHIGNLIGEEITESTSTRLVLSGANPLTLTGSGFTYDLNDQLSGGLVTHIDIGLGVFSANLAVAGVSAGSFGPWALIDATQTAFQTILSGADSLTGGPQNDVIHGYDGNDVVVGGGGSDTIWGGTGDDVIYGYVVDPAGGTFHWPAGQTLLRGEDGNDFIIGGPLFDDINGNKGNDTATGGAGDDWVVGGQGNDLLFGDAGGDIVYGNLGNDTCDGGDGNDLVRGGQGDDALWGGAGDDWLSGDRGNDTLTGGSGADTFHTFSGAGIDVVTDFNPVEGDRVQVDAGTTYTLSQQGADVMVDMGNGDELILKNVQLSTLPATWIFTL